MNGHWVELKFLLHEEKVDKSHQLVTYALAIAVERGRF